MPGAAAATAACLLCLLLGCSSESRVLSVLFCSAGGDGVQSFLQLSGSDNLTFRAGCTLRRADDVPRVWTSLSSWPAFSFFLFLKSAFLKLFLQWMFLFFHSLPGQNVERLTLIVYNLTFWSRGAGGRFINICAMKRQTKQEKATPGTDI